MTLPDASRNLDREENPWLHRLAWALAITVFPLIWMGGTVTTYDAGMAVPDWPRTYSYWFYPVQLWLAVWDVFLEHGHRLLAQVVGILAILLAVAIWRLDRRKWMRWIGVAVVAGVIAQGVLGGLRVLVDDRLLARIHGCTAPLYFGLCTAVVAWTSRAWRQPSAFSVQRSSNPQSLIPNPSSLAWLVTAAIYLEIVLGAQLRRPSADAAFGGALLPDWMKTLWFGQAATWFELLVWLKVLNAGLIALGVAWLVVGVLRRLRSWGGSLEARWGGSCTATPGATVQLSPQQTESTGRVLTRRAWWLAVVVTLQLVLAATAWVTNYGWPAWFTHWIWPLQSAVLAQGRLLVLLTTAHAAVGSLTFVASLSLALWLWRTSNQLTCATACLQAVPCELPGQHCLQASSGTRARCSTMDYLRLVRPRIVALVLLAMAVAAWTTAPSPPSWRDVTHALLGAALVIGGAIALNQRLECQGDAMMPRTAGRPLPTGRLSRRQVTVFGLITTATGLTYLALAANPRLTLLAAIGWLVYVGVYTPLKTRSTWQTPVGAAAGAMPVLLGAAAVGGMFSPWALVLFGIVYFWQFPHSMAIAWRYRREFAAAGVKVAAVTDPSGRTAGIWAVLGAVALLPVSLTPLLLGLAGAVFGVAVIALGLAYLGMSVWFARRRDDVSARRLLIASLIYLPAMLAVLLAAS